MVSKLTLVITFIGCTYCPMLLANEAAVFKNAGPEEVRQLNDRIANPIMEIDSYAELLGQPSINCELSTAAEAGTWDILSSQRRFNIFYTVTCDNRITPTSPFQIFNVASGVLNVFSNTFNLRSANRIRDELTQEVRLRILKKLNDVGQSTLSCEDMVCKTKRKESEVAK